MHSRSSGGSHRIIICYLMDATQLKLVAGSFKIAQDDRSTL
jgi:hypothetical protein